MSSSDLLTTAFEDDGYIDIPDRKLDLLIKFLNQNHGKLSSRAMSQEFAELSYKELGVIEGKFAEIFVSIRDE